MACDKEVCYNHCVRNCYQLQAVYFEMCWECGLAQNSLPGDSTPDMVNMNVLLITKCVW